jgi:hypothetical protein
VSPYGWTRNISENNRNYRIDEQKYLERVAWPWKTAHFCQIRRHASRTHFCILRPGANSVGMYNFQLAQRSILERGLSADVSRISKKFREAFVRFASNTARLVSTSVSTSFTAACYLRRVLLARVTGGINCGRAFFVTLSRVAENCDLSTDHRPRWFINHRAWTKSSLGTIRIAREISNNKQERGSRERSKSILVDDCEEFRHLAYMNVK